MRGQIRNTGGLVYAEIVRHAPHRNMLRLAQMHSSSFDPDRDIRYYFDTASFLIRSALEIDRELAEKTGRNFNIFDVFEANYETLLSRILRELLDPNGCHGQGIRFLRTFFAQCERQCGKTLTETEDLSKARVIAEWSTGEAGRRIDIVIHLASNRLIGIENKPRALEGPDQLDDYAEALFNRSSNNFFLVYLCGYGGKPSTLQKYDWLREQKRFVDLRYNRRDDEASLKLWAENCAQLAEADKLRMFMRDFAAWLAKFDEITGGNGSDV